MIIGGQQRFRDTEAERLSGGEVDDQLDFCHPLHRQFRRPVAVENAPGINAELVVPMAKAAAIAHQAASQDVLAECEHRGQRVPGRQCGELFRAPGQQGTGADQDRTDALLRKSCEGRFEVAIGAGIHDDELQAQRGCRRQQFGDGGLGVHRGRVRENAEARSIGYQLAEQLQSFRHHLALQKGDAGEVRAGPVEAGDETRCDRVTAGEKDDGNGRGRCLGRARYGNGGGYDHGDAAADEIGGEGRQSIQLVLRITILDRHVPALDVAGFFQALKKRNGGVLVVDLSGLGAEEPDHRHCCLLRV
jgi:hypothetical protein